MRCIVASRCTIQLPMIQSCFAALMRPTRDDGRARNDSYPFLGIGWTGTNETETIRRPEDVCYPGVDQSKRDRSVSVGISRVVVRIALDPAVAWWDAHWRRRRGREGVHLSVNSL